GAGRADQRQGGSDRGGAERTEGGGGPPEGHQLAIMIAWNEFLFALLFLLERPDRWTVSLGLSRLSGSIEVPSTVLMAGSVVLTVPIVVLFFVAERRLVEGLTAGGEKG